MNVSKECLHIIKKFEGFKAKPYLCPAGIPTIGYGSTYYFLSDNKVKLTDRAISPAYAESLLICSIYRYEQAVKRYVSAKINQNQFDALVSFCYNVGNEAFRKSTLLKRINANPNDERINAEFKRWIFANGRILNGLVKRRKEEAKLYFTK